MTEHAFLFETTAPYYARFRPGYPNAFFQHVIQRFGVNGQGRLLDLGCGTGQLTLPLAPYFTEVIGMDPEPEMLEEAKKQSHGAGITNIRWLRGSSGDLRVDPVRLVTMGRSFHWMDRDAVLARLFDVVEVGGGIVMVDDNSKWTVEPNCEQVTKKVIRKWLGERRRAGSAYYEHPRDRHEVVIARSPFGSMETYRLAYERPWTVDQIIGYCFSTSYCSTKVLGDNKQAFEDDLRAALMELEPSGFMEPVELEAFLLFMS
jgi:ubiquinone/menaquinone biosynthesis C-methylase UbiE